MVESQTGGDKQAILGGIVRARSADRALPSSLFPARAWQSGRSAFCAAIFCVEIDDYGFVISASLNFHCGHCSFPHSASISADISGNEPEATDNRESFHTA